MYSSDHLACKIETILNTKDNKICIDCGKEAVSYLILDYSGFICEKCYQIHGSLNLCQTIKPLSSPLSEFDIQIASIGGNTALFEYWDFYTLNYKTISYKYSTNASQVYKTLLTEILNYQESTSVLLDYETGRQQSEVTLNTPTSLIKEVKLEKNEKRSLKKLKPKKSLITKIDEKIQEFGDSVISSQIYKEFEIGMQSLSNDLNDLFK